MIIIKGGHHSKKHEKHCDRRMLRINSLKPYFGSDWSKRGRNLTRDSENLEQKGQRPPNPTKLGTFFDVIF